MVEVLQVAMGLLTMTILFAASYLFWNWYSNKEKHDYSFNLNENENAADEGVDGDEKKNLANSNLEIEKLLSKNDQEVFSGETDRYNWNQNDKEVEMYIPVPPNVKGKDINCKIRSNGMTLSVNGEIFIHGDFYAAVVPDECNWQIDGDGEERRIWISLYKETPTTRNQHWKCVLQGDAEIDTSSLGPPVHQLDVNDKNGIQEALKRVSKYKK